MKISKKLLSSIVALIVAVVMCVGVCLAWFTMNKEVSSDGANSTVVDSKAGISVTAYFLKQAMGLSTTEYSTIKVHSNDKNNDGKLSSGETMLKYNTDPLSATALLLEISVYAEEAGDYHVSAATGTSEFNATDTGVEIEDVKQYDGYLSNVVYFAEVAPTVSAEGVMSFAVDHAAVRFSLVNNGVMQRETPVLNLSFAENELGKYKAKKVYMLMDYSPELMGSLFSKVEAGAADSSLKDVNFKNDVNILFTEGKADIPTGDEAAVEYTINLINAIGEVTQQSGVAIVTARNAYDKLTASQKAQVPAETLAVLVAAEESFAAFAVDSFNSLVDGLGEAALSDQYLQNLESAEAAYAALTDEQKAEATVQTSYETLTQKRAAYNKLVDDTNAAQLVIDAINNELPTEIPPTVSSDEEKRNIIEQVNAVKAAYDGLSPERKSLVTNSKKLEDAIAAANAITVETVEDKSVADIFTGGLTMGTPIVLDGVSVDSTSTLSASNVSATYGTSGTADYREFTKRLELNSDGTTSSNSIKLTVTKPLTLVLYVTSSGSERTLTLIDSSGKNVEGCTLTIPDSKVYKKEIQITAAGTYYLVAGKGKVRFFGMEVK